MPMCVRHAAKLFPLLLLTALTLGCSEERVVSDDPAQIEKERQQHLEMTRRELEEG